MQAIITVAPPMAGKSFFAKSLSKTHTEINRDNTRLMLSGCATKIDYWKQKRKTIKEYEEKVTDYCDKYIKLCALKGLDIVCSDTNLNEQFRKDLVYKLETLGYDVFIKDDFDISWNVLWKRNEESGGDYVKQNVLYSMWKKWLEYKNFKTYTPDENLPKAVIFDVDGTLARMSNRSPFDWKRVGEDSVIEQNKLLLQGLKEKGLSVIIFTGRDGCCEYITKMWLEDNNIPFDDFYIRDEGNKEKDFVVKERMLWKAAEKWCIVGVCDDRPQVVNHWWDLGLHVWAVGDQRFNF